VRLRASTAGDRGRLIGVFVDVGELLALRGQPL